MVFKGCRLIHKDCFAVLCLSFAHTQSFQRGATSPPDRGRQYTANGYFALHQRGVNTPFLRANDEGRADRRSSTQPHTTFARRAAADRHPELARFEDALGNRAGAIQEHNRRFSALRHDCFAVSSHACRAGLFQGDFEGVGMVTRALRRRRDVKTILML